MGLENFLWDVTYKNAGKLKLWIWLADDFPPLRLTSLLRIEHLKHIQIPDSVEELAKNS